MLAKVCSDRNKPNGQFYLPPDRKVILDFVRQLPVRKVCRVNANLIFFFDVFNILQISGIGAVSEQMLKALDIVTCGDLWKQRGLIKLLFSKLSSSHFLRISLGLGSGMLR